MRRLERTLWIALAVAALSGCGAHPPVLSGEALFTRAFTPEEGLGPFFNAQACSDCHSSPSPGGVPADGLEVVFRVAQLDASGFDELVGRGGPVARTRSVSELGAACAEAGMGVPAAANVVSTRNTLSLFGVGAIADIPEDVILQNAAAQPESVRGRVNRVGSELGRFGWKAQSADLMHFVAEALRNEHGLTSAFFPEDVVASTCDGASPTEEVDLLTLTRLTAFVRTLPAPAQPEATSASGREVFERMGCSHCHTPSLHGLGLYSDLLIHDVGTSLDDGFIQGDAKGRDWRTTPLWGLKHRTRFLHDGRASRLDEAILAHGGQASDAANQFATLAASEREAVLAFLSQL